MNEIIDECSEFKKYVSQQARKIAIDLLNESETYEEAVGKLQVVMPYDNQLSDLVYSEILKEALKEKVSD